MSELPKCMLCGCTPIRLIDGSVKHNELTSNCSLRLAVLKGEEWNALMGGGEAVAWTYKAPHGRSVSFIRVPDGDLQKDVIVTPLYAGPSQAVDGAVLLDAALFRWLIDGPRSGPVWNNVLTEEQRDGHCDIRAAIIAAMKGEG